ncbi:MAG UNVERIFIED_CONTAM: hypothetical protein LVT10_25390 [Anaerolineae bacterium]|jgi:hypothetical protein
MLMLLLMTMRMQSTAMQQRQTMTTSKTTISIPGGGGIHSTLVRFPSINDPSILQYSSSVLLTEKGHSIPCRLHTKQGSQNNINSTPIEHTSSKDRQAGSQAGSNPSEHGMPSFALFWNTLAGIFTHGRSHGRASRLDDLAMTKHVPTSSQPPSSVHQVYRSQPFHHDGQSSVWRQTGSIAVVAGKEEKAIDR